MVNWYAEYDKLCTVGKETWQSPNFAFNYVGNGRGAHVGNLHFLSIVYSIE